MSQLSLLLERTALKLIFHKYVAIDSILAIKIKEVLELDCYFLN